MPFVVDASALVFATTEVGAAATRLLERLRSDACHAPHVIDAEVGQVLRRKVRCRELPEPMARALLGIAPDLIDHRYDQRGLLAFQAWRLRGNVSFYDALYVGLAASLDLPLVTLDRRLARMRSLPCRVEVPSA